MTCCRRPSTAAAEGSRRAQVQDSTRRSARTEQTKRRFRQPPTAVGVTTRFGSPTQKPPPQQQLSLPTPVRFPRWASWHELPHQRHGERCRVLIGLFGAPTRPKRTGTDATTVVSLSNAPAHPHDPRAPGAGVDCAEPGLRPVGFDVPRNCRRRQRRPPLLAAGRSLRCRGLDRRSGCRNPTRLAGARNQPATTCWHSPHRNDAARYRERWGLVGRTLRSEQRLSAHHRQCSAVGDLVAGLEPRAARSRDLGRELRSASLELSLLLRSWVTMIQRPAMATSMSLAGRLHSG